MYYMYVKWHNGMEEFKIDEPFERLFDRYMELANVKIRSWIYDENFNLVCGREDR